MNRITHISISLCLCLTIQAAPKAKKEVYIPMDYSTCGYHASEQAIPDVKTAVYVGWQEGDCATLIQQAIDQVAKKKVDANGHRGAILLGEGVFHLSKPLRITTSGIVLRGMGRAKTTLVKQGVDRGAVIYVEAKEKVIGQNQVSDSIVSKKVVAGSMTTADWIIQDGSPQISTSSGTELLRLFLERLSPLMPLSQRQSLRNTAELIFFVRKLSMRLPNVALRI